MISRKVKHFVFTAELSPPFTYLPGEFITIHFEKNDKILRRSYSVANQPRQDNRIEIAAGYVENGPGTDLLFNLQPGDKININGPFGRLTLKENMPGRYIFVATSTGVTPYRAMISTLKQHLKNHPRLQIVMLQGVQTHEDVLYGEEFLALANEFPDQVNFRVYLSRAPDDNLESYEYKGYVQSAFSELRLDTQNDIVYLCGNPGMIDEAFAYLQNKGFTMQQIVREKYISR